MSKKEKFIIHYNNGYIDILIGEEILKDQLDYKYSNEDAFGIDYKNGWLYEITIGNIQFNEQEEEYTTFSWTEFDILKAAPIRYIGKYVKTKSELAEIEKQELIKYKERIQDLVTSQTKDNLNWTLCKSFSDFGIFTVTGESFRMYKLHHKFKDESLTWENLNFINSECKKFFGIKDYLCEF